MPTESKDIVTSFRGVNFECVSAQDQTSRALVQHLYPYQDGGEVEDMGQEPARFTLKAIFYPHQIDPLQPDLLTDYKEDLNAFLRALDGIEQPASKDYNPLSEDEARRYGVLHHPTYGMMNVQVQGYRVSRDADSVNSAEVEVDFIRAEPRPDFFPKKSVYFIIPQPLPEIGGWLGALAKLLKFLDKIKAWRDAIVAKLNQFSAIMSDLREMADSLTPAALFGPVSKAISGVCRSFIDLRSSATDLVSAWRNFKLDLSFLSLFSSPGGISVDGAGNVTALPAPAGLMPIQPGTEPTDEQVVALFAVVVAVNISVAMGNMAGIIFESEAADPTLTPEEIEDIANEALASISATLDQIRQILSIEAALPVINRLKDQAASVREAAARAIEARAPLIYIQVKSPGNLRLVAHEFYGDHNRALELQRLNGLRNPNSIRRGDVLRAYAF